MISLLDTQAPTHALASSRQIGAGTAACWSSSSSSRKAAEEAAPLWEFLVTMAHRWPMVSLVSANSARTKKNMKNLLALAWKPDMK